MREAPALQETALMGAIEAGYGMPIRALSFLPLGADSASAAYRAHAGDGAIYFLKLRALHGFSPASLLVPLYLHEHGIPNLLPPLRTLAGAAWVCLGDFALTLYPFVEGRMGADGGLSERQWTALGTMLRRIHACKLPSGLISIVPRERFTPSRREVMGRLQAAIESHAISDALQGRLAEFWKAREGEIRALVAGADELACRLREIRPSLVLCHADLHTWNVLLDSGERLWLVDWDETTLALKERDLMFVMGGIGRGLVSPEASACFMQGYGAVDIDPKALTYYRYAWAVQDMGAYGEQVFFSPGLGEPSRRHALEAFMSLFEPGNIVAIALGSDGHAA